MQLTTWRRLAALALLLAAAALAVAGCDRRASDPALPSTGSTLPGSTPGSTPGTTTTGSGMRALDSLTPALPAASAASR